MDKNSLISAIMESAKSLSVSTDSEEDIANVNDSPFDFDDDPFILKRNKSRPKKNRKSKSMDINHQKRTKRKNSGKSSNKHSSVLYTDLDVDQLSLSALSKAR